MNLFARCFSDRQDCGTPQCGQCANFAGEYLPQLAHKKASRATETFGDSGLMICAATGDDDGIMEFTPPHFGHIWSLAVLVAQTR